MTYSARRSTPSRRAFTLTELAIVLGIIGLILGAIWTAASKVYTNQKVAKATTELLAISQSVRSLYASKAAMDGTGDVTVSMANFGVFPTDMLQMVNGVNQPMSPWGTPVEIYASYPDASHFIVEFDGQDRGRTTIPSQYCAPLLMENYNQTAQDSPGNIDVEYKSGTWAGYNVSGPLALFSTCTTASFIYSIH